MNNLQSLNASLSSTFGMSGKPAKRVEPSYRAFRAECKRLGLTYRMARDGFIELSDGRSFPHYGDWFETLARLGTDK